MTEELEVLECDSCESGCEHCDQGRQIDDGTVTFARRQAAGWYNHGLRGPRATTHGQILDARKKRQVQHGLWIKEVERRLNA